MILKTLFTASLAALTLTLTSCQHGGSSAAGGSFRPSSAPAETRAQFLQQVWVAKAYRGQSVSQSFSKVYLAPVNTALMEKQSWWQMQEGVPREQLVRDTSLLAQRLRSKFNQAIATYPGGKISLASGPGPGVLVVELAITGLVPSNAYWNAGATAAGMVVPGAGLLSAAGSGSISLEGRARNGADNQIIATFKDRRFDKAAPVNIGSYTWYHGAEVNVDDWAAEFAQFLNSNPGEVVKRHSRVTLKPW